MKIFWSPSLGGFVDEQTHGALQVKVLDEEAVASLRAAIAGVDQDEQSDEHASLARAEADGLFKWIDNPACLIPADAVEMSVDQHAELMAAVADGLQLITGPEGLPVAVPQIKTPEEQLAALRRQRDRDLAASDWTQLPDALKPAARKPWTAYRDALRDYPARVEAAIAAGEVPDTIPYPEKPA